MGFFGPSDIYNGKRVVRVKVIGVRTAEQTKVLGTYNFGIYSFLVEYEDGSVDIAEEQMKSPGMKTLMRFVEF